LFLNKLSNLHKWTDV